MLYKYNILITNRIKILGNEKKPEKCEDTMQQCLFVSLTERWVTDYEIGKQ